MSQEPSHPTFDPDERAPSGTVHSVRPDPSVSVVIPNWNGEALLARCLASLDPGGSGESGDGPQSEGRQPGQVVQVIVVDDASTDESVALVRRAYPSVTLVEHGANRGFAASCNDGAAVARGRWLLFLNSDAFIASAGVVSLVRVADTLGAVALGPQLLFEDGSLQDSGGMFPTPRAIGLTKLGRLLGRDLPGASHRRRVGAATPCEWVSGACLLVKATVFRAVGGFDERLTYVEDVELGRRISDAGGRLFLTDSVRVTHVGGATFGLIAPRVPRMYRESQRVFARAYMSPWQRVLLRTMVAAERAVRAVAAGLRGAGRRTRG